MDTSSEEEEDAAADVSVIPTDFLGADINEGSSSDSESTGSDSEISVMEKSDRESSESEEVGEVPVVGVLQERGHEAAKPSKKEQMERKTKQQKSKEKETYEVGEFVTAVYEGKWLVAQVDINQDKAGESHVNLSYMELVGENQFKWPKNHDLLLTLKEDILTRCSPPCLVGGSLRVFHVGLNPSDAQAADAALAALMVYLQKLLKQNLKKIAGFFYSWYPSSTYSCILGY